MASLKPNVIDDMVNSTLNELGSFKYENLSYTLLEHIVQKRLMRKKRMGFQSGKSVDFNVKTKTGKQASHSELFDTDEVNIVNLLGKGNVPWTFTKTHWGYDNREPEFNSGASQILDMIKVRRDDAIQSVVGLFEDDFWATPDATNDKAPFGIKYWITRNATEGFNGAAPSGFTDVGGLNPSTVQNWKNWTSQYAAISKTDLIRKIRKAVTMTNFKPPIEGNPYAKGQDFTHLTNYDVVGELEEYLQTENDDLGTDIAGYDGMVTFRSVPVEHVPKLDADTKNPWYGINWNFFEMIFMSGQFAVQSEPMKASHNTRAIFYDWTYQYICRNRRMHFVCNTA